MKLKPTVAWGSSLLLSAAVCSASVNAGEFVDSLTSGKTAANFRLRYENVEQDNLLDDANALTLRSLLTYSSADYKGFSTTLEFEDVRTVFGGDHYTVPQTGFKTGEHSVVADPATTELDQAFVQYKKGAFATKVGRQVILLDGHRFVGHVGWRQDKQTFDGATATYKVGENFTGFYGYLAKRNRIFAEVLDQDSSDHLLNLAFTTPVGKAVVYGYFLDLDSPTTNTLDTLGVSFSGAVGDDSFKALYAIEYAMQDSAVGVTDSEAEYLMVEGGVALGKFTGKLGMEVLGSDDGAYGFQTPLATLHIFNGWADTFLSTPNVGLVDTYVSARYSFGKFGLTGMYHIFEADEETPTVSDLGNEIDVELTYAATKNLSFGLKAALYSAGDAAAGFVDTDKFWVSTEFKF